MNDIAPQEIIICENGSTGSLEQLIRSKYKSKVIFHSQKPNIGFDLNVLEAISLATSDYVWILGDDDLMHKNAISSVKDTIKRNSYPSALVVDFRLISRLSGLIQQQAYSLSSHDFCIANLSSFAGSVAFEGFVSVFIFKRNDIDFVNARNYAGTWFIHLCLLLECIAQGKHVVEHPVALVDNCSRLTGRSDKSASFHFTVLLKYLRIIEHFSQKIQGKEAVLRRLSHDIVYKKLRRSIGVGYIPPLLDIAYILKGFACQVHFWLALLRLPFFYCLFMAKQTLKALLNQLNFYKN